MNRPSSSTSTSSTLPQTTKTVIIFTCLVGLTAFYVYHCLYWYGGAVDDAYITFRYARNLCNGLGLVYNPGERIEGYSNFSWLMLIALGMKLGFQPILVAKFLGVLSGIGVILCSFWIYNSLSPKPQAYGSLLPAFLLATNSFFCYWSLRGMETVFFSSILILSVALYLRENQNSYPLSAYALGLLCLSRPEGLGYLGVFLAFDVFWRIRRRQLPDKYCWWFYGTILLILSGYLGFKWIYFGSLLPNTYYAKVIFPFQNLDSTLVYLLDFYVHPNISLLLLLLISVATCIYFQGVRVWLLIPLLLFNWFYILYVLFDWMPNYRYHMHTLPILFTIIALGFSKFIRQLNKRKQLYGRISAIILVLAMGYYVGVIIRTESVSTYRTYYIDNKPKPHITEKPAGWLWRMPEKVRSGFSPVKIRPTLFLIENTTSEMTVGMRDIGFAGFITNCRVYDRDLLIHKEARALSAILRRQDERAIKAYIFGELRENLENYNPDFFLYPQFKLIIPEQSKWKWLDQMYNNYFDTHMEIVKEFRATAKKFPYIYYRKKGLTWRSPLEELIHKYEKIVQEHPGYPVFRNRLNKLYRQLEEKQKDVGRKNINLL